MRALPILAFATAAIKNISGAGDRIGVMWPTNPIDNYPNSFQIVSVI
jgi:hypothetical protein